MGRFSITQISLAGVIAALYVVLSLAFAPISFGIYQIRVAEALTILPFLMSAAIPGLYVGCVLANVFGNMGWLDIVVGPLITLIAAFVTAGTARLRRDVAAQAAVVPLVLMAAGGLYLLGGLHLSWRTFVGAGLAGAAVLLSIRSFSRHKAGAAAQGGRAAAVQLALAGLLTGVAILLLREVSDPYFVVCGALLLAATVGGAAILGWSKTSAIGPSLLLAPLAPVVLNAFGVAAYLAPIMGVNYWFAVQMIGVGQLIACYVLGVPLLVVLRQRGIVRPATR